MSSFLILGDPHCGAGLSLGKQYTGFSLNSRIIDQSNLLDWVLHQAIDRGISDIIITGDVFEDPNPSLQVIRMFIDWLQECSHENKNVHIIYGNHDFLRSGQFYSSPLEIVSAARIENVFVYSRNATVHWDDISITFMPFRDRKSFDLASNAEALDKLKKQIPYHLSSMPLDSKKVLIGHLALEGSIPIGNELDDAINELICPLSYFEGYDYVLMGHVHKFQILQQKPLIGHIGSMDISNFGEEDQEKFIAILDDNSEIEFVKIPTRKVKNLTIEIPEDSDPMVFIEKEIRNSNLDKSITKVSLKVPSKLSPFIDRKKIEDMLYSNGVFHNTKISEEKKTEVIETNKIKLENDVNEFSAIQMYASSLDKEIQEDFINFASEIVKEYNGTN